MMGKRPLKALLILLPLLIAGMSLMLLVILWNLSKPDSQVAQPESAGSTTQVTPAQTSALPSPLPPVEQSVIPIPLSGPLAEPSAEISGLAWYGDTLMLLPQYPRRRTNWHEGYIYAISKSAILDYLDGRVKGPLEPAAIRFDAYGLTSQIPNFQGFESIGFHGDRIYLTIESGAGNQMMGYLVSGLVASDLSKIVVDPAHLVSIEPQAALDNKADEALLILDDRLLTFYEANGAAINRHPVAHVFTLDLQPLGAVSLPSLEYRITDAARIPGGNRFWVTNTFVLADIALLPASDPLAERHGQGQTHSALPVVERLVQMEYHPSGITFGEDAPVQLQLAPLEFRNWEGLALLDDRGFLLATDKYPSTILAFVPRP